MPGAGVVVLTGGTGRRLGGTDKAGLHVGGTSLLQRALAVAAPVGEVVVVGDAVPGVITVREEPPGGGPAAALLAGVAALPAVSWVVALAVDMPLVTTGTVERLLAAADGADGALLVDGDGRRQLLCAAYSRDALLAAAPPNPPGPGGMPLRRLVEGLALVEVPAEGHEAQDVDTPEDLALVRDLLA